MLVTHQGSSYSTVARSSEAKVGGGQMERAGERVMNCRLSSRQPRKQATLLPASCDLSIIQRVWADRNAFVEHLPRALALARTSQLLPYPNLFQNKLIPSVQIARPPSEFELTDVHNT
ncbi:hypothetical protein BT69DRAFT_745736 [Atractiella rhizophila]|nr:hypothetical protein BT69DRAFT_904967 [Atractiella rhizophila]KAH8916714.1 hypothetical protein BT69DRAFT_745736 [Atractiella rhizophila]